MQTLSGRDASHGQTPAIDAVPRCGCIVPFMGMKPAPRVPGPSRSTSVADALFTKGQQRVLGVLFGNPDRSFYANEIIALAGTGTGAVQRELARLESAGLVTVERVGVQKHYRANARAPVFAELRALVLKTSGLADVLRAALAPLADDISAAFVFGSVAKRQDTAFSDMDLMVVSDTAARSIGHRGDAQLQTTSATAGASPSRCRRS